MKQIVPLILFLFFTHFNYGQNIETITKQKPIAIGGSLDIRAIGYASEGITARRSPLMYMLSGSPTVTIYGIAVPINFTFSEQNRSFRQPFNQYGMSPTFKWATAHIGYRNVNFSPYTLAGYTMLGAGFELNPQKLKIGFMMGRLNKATTVDTTTGAIQPHTFARTGYAMKLGYGSEKSFFNISFLKAKDNNKNFKGDVSKSQTRPASNMVLAADLRFAIAKNLFVFADAGVSVYTRDFDSKLALDLDSIKALKTIGKLINLNGTSEYYTALSTGVGYASKLISVKMAYKKVDPNFQSMGAYFFQNDIENITISPTINTLKGKLRLLASLGIQQDNTRKQKQATTKRVIALANLSYEISTKLGLDASFANFSSNSTPTVAKIQNKFILTQTTQNLSISPRLILPSKNITNVIIVSYNLNNLVDLNAETKELNTIQSAVMLLNHNLTLNQMGLTILSGANYIENKLSIGTIKNLGLTLGVSKSFLKNKLQLTNNNSYTISTLPQGKAKVINIGANMSYQPVPKHKLNLRLNTLNNTPGLVLMAEQGKFSEQTVELGYTLGF